MMKRCALLLLVSSLFLPQTISASDWSSFRGPNGKGIGSKASLPPQLSLSQVSWKIESGKGGSSTIVHEKNVYLTSFEGDARTLRCLDLATGKERWSRSIQRQRTETATPPNDPAICTPTCNQELVVAHFPDAGLIACSHTGDLLWQKDIGPFTSMHGISASPLLVEGKLIVAVDQLQEPYILCLEAKSGKALWKEDRLIGVTGGYSSPAAMHLDGTNLIISAAPGELVGYHLENGEKAFSVMGLTNAPVGMPTVVGNRIYYSEPPGEPIPMEALGNADKNKDGVIESEEVKNSVGTLRLIERIDRGFGNSDGKVDKSEWDRAFGSFLNKGGLSCVEVIKDQAKFQGKVVWKYNKSTPYIPSAIVVDSIVYTINDGGVVTSFSAETGEAIKRGRLAGATGQYYSSPVSDGERLLFANLQGKLTVVQSGKEWQAASTLDLEEAIVATPMLHDGKLFVRTESTLYCFEGDKKSGT